MSCCETRGGRPHPTEANGRSRHAAERGLDTLAMDWETFRPVGVYGPGVKGNMPALAAVIRG
ncbi:hypothetical protein [Microvirga antarctica]|uniref:hypothetical protein n=1 Tax=Microvirga antarctica TaxID=2819233 RepID=UPI001B31816E|nr:hypothetical protein [Microvirga antarctica]